ncbi:MAG TPA: hypothetical protein VIV11_04880 [Kofleriaceae bacterium]
MRFITCLLLTALASITLTTQIAAACGGYVQVDPAPRLLLMSSHGFHEPGAWRLRTFVLLEEAPQIDDNTVWTPVAPGRYDGPKIAALPRLVTPRAVTLIGPSGVRVVETDQLVAFSKSPHIGLEQIRTAVEVRVGHYEKLPIAVAGRDNDAKWHELGNNTASEATKQWLAKRGIKTQHVKLQAIQGGKFSVVRYFSNGTAQFLVRQGDREVGRASGNLIGAMMFDGRMLVAYITGGRVATLDLPAAAPGVQR